MTLTQMAQMFENNYVAFGYDLMTKKKLEISISAESVSAVRSKLSTKNPRMVIQGIYPDIEDQNTVLWTSEDKRVNVDLV